MYILYMHSLGAFASRVVDPTCRSNTRCLLLRKPPIDLEDITI